MKGKRRPEKMSNGKDNSFDPSPKNLTLFFFFQQKSMFSVLKILMGYGRNQRQNPDYVLFLTENDAKESTLHRKKRKKAGLKSNQQTNKQASKQNRVKEKYQNYPIRIGTELLRFQKALLNRDMEAKKLYIHTHPVINNLRHQNTIFFFFSLMGHICLSQSHVLFYYY